MEKFYLPSTPTISSLIYQTWAERKFPVNDLRGLHAEPTGHLIIINLARENPRQALCRQQMAHSSLVSIVAERLFLFVWFFLALCTHEWEFLIAALHTSPTTGEADVYLGGNSVLSYMVIKYKLYTIVHQSKESQRFTQLVAKLDGGRGMFLILHINDI